MGHSPEPGDVVLHYRVLRAIGSGGMGVVYEAEDTKLGRHVALKFLPPALAGDRPALERFQREARAASALNHPNICTIHAIEEWEGQHFIAMELLDGHSLDRRIGARPLGWDVIADIGMQVADALDAAHQRGIVHRDIKPANIFLTRDGRAKVLDFGVATIMAGRDDGETMGAATAAAKLTSPGTTVGTVAYMSPEQARAEALDARTDLFSLAAVLYEMGTARPAFAGKTSAVIFQQILGADPEPPRDVNAALPPKLEEIIVKGLEKDRELRYQTAAELRGDLKRLKRDVSSGKVAFAPEAATAARTLSSGAVIISEARRHKGLATALAVLMLAIVATAAYGINAFVSRDKSMPAAVSGAGAAPIRVTTSGDVQGCGAISPDGKYVSYCTFAGELRVMQVATGSTVVLGQHRGAASFSPDGDYVLISNATEEHPNGVLLKIPVFGGEPQRVVTNITGAPAISPDGKQIAFLRGFIDDLTVAVILADADGSNERRLLTSGKDAWLEYPGLSWSHDGRWLAGPLGSSAGGYHARPVAIDAATGKFEVLGTRKFASIGRTVWLPGNVVLFSAPERADGPDQFWTVSHPGGEPVRLTNDARGFGNISVGVTADGKTIATVPVELISNLWATNADATAPLEQWTSGTRQDAEDDIRPLDTGRVYYRSSDGTGVGVWSLDAPGGTPRKLTRIPVGSPSLPSDGRFVAYAGRYENRSAIWRAQPDGSGARMLVDADEAGNALVSPDGAWIYFASHPGVSRIPADGGNVGKLHDLAYPLDVSPDGRLLLAILPNDANDFRLVVLDAQTGKTLQDVPAPADARWTARWGRSAEVVTYIVARDNVGNLWEQPLAGGPARQLTTFTEGEIFGFGYSPDRTRLFLGRGKRTGDLYLLKDVR